MRLLEDPSPAPAPAPAAAPAPRTYEVQPGDHLWSIAERRLAQHLGRQPTEAEVVPYWRSVIEINRNRLADPRNPDLIFPEQVLVLPDLS
jgi:nucleoid-associated protein YgaU